LRFAGEAASARASIFRKSVQVSGEIQIFHLAVDSSGRPGAQKECEQCGGCRKLHRHSSYTRNRGVEGSERAKVERFEGLMDEQMGKESDSVTDGGARPPPASEIEKGNIRRAVRKLSERVTFLFGLLGQQMPVLGSVDIGGFCRAIREVESTLQILIALARDF